jgi:hypothetical protein
MHKFSNFLNFLNHICLNFKSRSNSRRPPFLLGWRENQVCDWFWGPIPLGNLQEFPPNFLKCSLCTHSSNLNLNGFISKIIQYMAAGRDNSSNLGFGLLTRSPSRENLSGGIMHNSLGSHFTKNTHFAPLRHY